MRMVTLLGSPRSKGNSATIAQRIIDTAAQHGVQNHTFELNRLNYRGCQACYACKNATDHCIVRDDLEEVLAAVREADLLVMASPVYYGDVSAQLKGYIDRTFSYLVADYITAANPSRLKPKKMIFVLTQGHADESMFADIFPRYQNFLKWQGFREIRLVRACGTGPGRSDMMPERVLHLAEETVRQLVNC